MICSEIFSTLTLTYFKFSTSNIHKFKQKNDKSNVKTVFSMWTRIDWSVSHFSVTNIKSSYDVEKWKKEVFYDLRELTNPLWEWRKEAESILYLF